MEKHDICKYADKLLKKYTIDIFSSEVNIFELLNKISNEKNVENIDIKTLNEIEKYLDTKVKIQNTQNDYNFLSELANNLELQKVRKSDKTEFKVISFKIKDIYNNEYTFLTRKCLKEYVKLHSDIFDNPVIMEIDSKGNLELEKLLEIVKRNFKNSEFNNLK